MDLPRMAGLAMIAGALVFFAAAIPLPGIYGIQDADERVARIRANETAFVLSQTLFAVGAIVVAIGFVLLAASLVARRDPLLPAVGALGVVAGAALWAYFMYDRTTNVDGYFRDYGHVPTYVWASAVSTAVGLAAFGLIFLGFDGSSWVGYLTLVVVVLTIGAAVLAPEVVPPQLLYLPPLVMGIVLVGAMVPELAHAGRSGMDLV